MPSVPPVSVCSAIRASQGFGLKPIHIFDSNFGPLLTLVDQIVILPIEWRKFILDACRIQAPVLQNNHLSPIFHSIHPRYASGSILGVSRTLSIDDLLPLIDDCTANPISASFLSYFVRAEATVRKDEFAQQYSISLHKEVLAATQPPPLTQNLNYNGIFSPDGLESLHDRIEPGRRVNPRVKHLITGHFSHLKQRWSNYATIPLFPAFNSRKNVGYTTQIEYLEVTGSDPFTTRGITTVDLLKLYFIEGLTIGGPLEVRQAWFFNDLKPRTYYCVGGDAYFLSLYIQDIANWIIQALPSTHPHSRFNVHRLYPISEDEIVITYDYSSFTTSLAELRYFLFHLANHFRGTCIDVLDRDGIRTIDVGQYLYAYNESINHHQVFSLERLEHLDSLLRQGRSGSLGVKGNIVLSTFLHGMSLADATGRVDRECCVGDDALTAILHEALDLFINIVNQLGDINPDKFSILPRPTLEEPLTVTSHQYKFLKRPLKVFGTGQVDLGVLDFFPSIADAIFPQGDGFHTSFSTPLVERVKTFVMQWGRFLSIQCDTGNLFQLNPLDLDFLLGGIRLVYDKYGLPLDGAVPGFMLVVKDKEEEHVEELLPIWIPPVCADALSTHWMDLLMIKYQGSYFERTVRVDGLIPPPLDVEEGEHFVSTSSKLLSFCVGLGYMKNEVLRETVVFDEESLQVELDVMQGNGEAGEMLYTYTCLQKPTWYFEVSIRYQPSLLNEDPDDALSRVTSMLG